jgi:hypothetical protein
MKLSTNLPCGLKVREHLGTLGMNVSPEADKAFVQEMKRTDPKRYVRLTKAMQVAGLEQQRQGNRKYDNCKAVLPFSARSDARFCDPACKQSFHRLAA